MRGYWGELNILSGTVIQDARLLNSLGVATVDRTVQMKGEVPMYSLKDFVIGVNLSNSAAICRESSSMLLRGTFRRFFFLGQFSGRV